MTRTTTKLSVNVNKVALLRNARPGEVPSVTEMSRLALEAGAAGITVHPRPDERHIRASDVSALAALLTEDAWADRESNIEGNPLDTSPRLSGGTLIDVIRQARPTQATLVPDSPEQSTSDHGFALRDDAVVAELTPIVAELKAMGCRVSLFVDPDEVAAARAAETGADRVELYTESFAQAFGTVQQEPVLERFVAAAHAARAAGLGVNAGHDLNLDNLGPFVAALSGVGGVDEVSIGHALVADALRLGMGTAVRAYLDLLATA
ncbi:MAG: pyridoxine 5'-phosphate synthase [Planctomycetota bacterium]